MCLKWELIMFSLNTLINVALTKEFNHSLQIICSADDSEAFQIHSVPIQFVQTLVQYKAKLAFRCISPSNLLKGKLTLQRVLRHFGSIDAHSKRWEQLDSRELRKSSISLLLIDINLLKRNPFNHWRQNVRCFVLPQRTSLLEQTLKSLQATRQLLSGKRLHLSTLPFTPFVVVPQDLQAYDQYTGFVFEVVRLFSLHFNFTYDVSFPTDGAFGGFVNGTWNGLKIDLAIAPFTVLYARAQVINYVWPLDIETSSVLIPAPTENTSLWGFLFPFEAEVWFCLLVALMLLAILLWLIFTLTSYYQLSSSEEKQTMPSLGISFLFALGVISGQAGYCPAKTHASRVLAGVWCLTAVIIVYTYTSSLILYLTVPNLHSLIETMADLAYRGVLMPIVLRYTSYELSPLNAPSDPFKGLGDLLRKYPKETRVGSNAEAAERVLTGKFGYLTEVPIIEELISRDWQTTGQCRLAEARRTRESFPTVFTGLITPKNGSYNILLQHKLLHFHEHGLVYYCAQQTLTKRNPCVSQTRQTPKEQSLHLKHLGSAFFLLGTGMVLSAVTFLLEYYYVLNISNH